MIARPLDRHSHSVHPLLGSTHGDNPDTRWDRGALYRRASVVATLPPLWPVVDYSTNPPTYVYFNGGRIVDVKTGQLGNPAGTGA